MEIQSLSICVPTKGCVNNCKFCVSRMHCNDYEDDKINVRDIKNRMRFARDNGCNTLIFTGTGEPLQNRDYLHTIFEINENKLLSSFVWIEFQTSGVMLDFETLKYLRDSGVTNISLSLSNIFDSERNSEICGIPDKLFFKIEELCEKIKSFGFNLRLSLNLTSDYDNKSPKKIMQHCKDLGANQITFRKLYYSPAGTPQDIWVKENRMKDASFENLKEYVRMAGIALEVLPFGATKYSYDEMSIVIDSDCMSKEVKDSLKYLILREDNKLYSRWDNKGSLVF